MPSFQTNNIKCVTDSDAHQQNMAFAPDLISQALTKRKEDKLSLCDANNTSSSVNLTIIKLFT